MTNRDDWLIRWLPPEPITRRQKAIDFAGSILLGLAIGGIIGLFAAALAGLAHAGSLPDRPDPRLTPGAVASASTAEVCAGGYSPSHRLRYGEPGEHPRWLEIIRAYRLTPAQVRGRIELDRLVPLCAGGADSAGNLWPEPIGQALAKDRIEAAMCHAVCVRGLRLDLAQRYFQSLEWLADVNDPEEK